MKLKSYGWDIDPFCNRQVGQAILRRLNSKYSVKKSRVWSIKIIYET